MTLPPASLPQAIPPRPFGTDAGGGVKISVIVPVLNEGAVIGEMLEDLSHHAPYEIIVVDGGSTDSTVRIAKTRARVISTGKGRARQMNEGARQACGDIFLFLHADTRLPKEGLLKIQEVIRHSARAGRFRMRFDDARWILRLYASYTRFHFFSYGDQGFFICKKDFSRLNGFCEETAFEDVDFYARLRRITKPVIIPDSVVTSARRFTQVGCVRQRFINLLLVGLYYTGMNVNPLKKKLYADIR